MRIHWDPSGDLMWRLRPHASRATPRDLGGGAHGEAAHALGGAVLILDDDVALHPCVTLTAYDYIIYIIFKI